MWIVSFPIVCIKRTFGQTPKHSWNKLNTDAGWIQPPEGSLKFECLQRAKNDETLIYSPPFAIQWDHFQHWLEHHRVPNSALRSHLLWYSGPAAFPLASGPAWKATCRSERRSPGTVRDDAGSTPPFGGGWESKENPNTVDREMSQDFWWNSVAQWWMISPSPVRA